MPARDVFDVMRAEAGVALKVLLADGGASRNDQLMQFQSDILGCPVRRTTSAEASPLGAAYLAGLGIGMWADLDAIRALPRVREQFTPHMVESERMAYYTGWQQAVARAILTPTP